VGFKLILLSETVTEVGFVFIRIHHSIWDKHVAVLRGEEEWTSFRSKLQRAAT